jgi:hypothetical protein
MGRDCFWLFGVSVLVQRVEDGSTIRYGVDKYMSSHLPSDHLLSLKAVWSLSLGPANEPSQASSPNADFYILQLLIFNTVPLPYQQPLFAQSARYIRTCSTFSHDEAQSSVTALPCTLRRHCFQNRTRPAQHSQKVRYTRSPTLLQQHLLW